MAKKPTIHTDIFAAYQLTNLSNEEKETIRHHIRKEKNGRIFRK